ncbi:MAG: hypothetical protein M3305_02825 [Actinomycetota bacterium]|nr:hypothetical protein [Actinomycetota bacterium]
MRRAYEGGFELIAKQFLTSGVGLVILVLIVLLLLFLVLRRNRALRRQEQLNRTRQEFGKEYERTA